MTNPSDKNSLSSVSDDLPVQDPLTRVVFGSSAGRWAGAGGEEEEELAEEEAGEQDAGGG